MKLLTFTHKKMNELEQEHTFKKNNLNFNGGKPYCDTKRRDHEYILGEHLLGKIFKIIKYLNI